VEPSYALFSVGAGVLLDPPEEGFGAEAPTQGVGACGAGGVAQPSKEKTVSGEPCARSARKLPKAITASEGNGGKKFSNAESAAIATYNDPSGRSPSQSVIE